MTRLEDRIAVQDRIWSALICSDLGEWAKSMACCTDDTTVDVTDYDLSIWPEPKGVPVYEFRRLASVFMPGLEVRQHKVTNCQIEVEGDTATSRSQVRAIHLLDRQVWEAQVTHIHHLRREGDGWKISNLNATSIHQSGKELVAAAR